MIFSIFCCEGVTTATITEVDRVELYRILQPAFLGSTTCVNHEPNRTTGTVLEGISSIICQVIFRAFGNSEIVSTCAIFMITTSTAPESEVLIIRRECNRAVIYISLSRKNSIQRKTCWCIPIITGRISLDIPSAVNCLKIRSGYRTACSRSRNSSSSAGGICYCYATCRYPTVECIAACRSSR